MTEEQINTLKHFLDRPKMYVLDADKKLVVPFLTGLETGDKNLNLTSDISSLLEKREGIKKNALGWPEQIQKYADACGIGWFDALRKLTADIITQSKK